MGRLECLDDLLTLEVLAEPDVGLHARRIACGFTLRKMKLCGVTASSEMCVLVDHERSSVRLILEAVDGHARAHAA